jgi:hypothetical protein
MNVLYHLFQNILVCVAYFTIGDFVGHPVSDPDGSNIYLAGSGYYNAANKHILST